MKLILFIFQYVDGLVADFDLLVIGGYIHPSTKFVYKYLMGVQKKTLTSTVVIPHKDEILFTVFFFVESEFFAVANVSSGLTISKRIEVNDILKPYWKNCSHIKSGRSTIVNNPPGMHFGSQTPDFWIQPEHSIIFEVKKYDFVRLKPNID